jgi:hypothetical protein|mmetsp:Transcript_23566/g.53617  ORF Transcript_23566/g.53617 Transcript_23566/m.53617 type:complete len:477 (-) Transcript_23566:813-2243(-)
MSLKFVLRSGADVLDADPANKCMLHHESNGSTKILGYQMFRWQLCRVHGWQGLCNSPCRLSDVIVQTSGKPCHDVRRPPQPEPTGTVTHALLARADRAAIDGQAAMRPIWHGRMLRVRGFVHDGFWVRAHFVLSQGMWASLRQIPFFVELHRHASCHDLAAACTVETAVSMDECLERQLCDAYSSDPHSATGAGGASGWEEYFRPINDIPLRELHKTLRPESIVELSCHAAWYYNAGIMGGNPQVSIYAETWAIAAAYRARNSALVAKWVRVQPYILKLADSEWQRITRGRGAVIGVHLRGTDKFILPKIPPASYYEFIDAFLAHNQRVLAQNGRPPPGHRRHQKVDTRPSGQNNSPLAGEPIIFLATDDRGYQQDILNRYGPENVSQLFDGNILRAEANQAIWSGNSADHAHGKGLQVLLDTLLLAKCDFLLKSASAVSEFAIYFNLRLANDSFDFNLQGQPFPEWMHHSPLLNS